MHTHSIKKINLKNVFLWDKFVVSEEEEIMFTQQQHPIQNQKKKIQSSPSNVHLTEFMPRENYLSNMKLKLFEENKTIVGYF